MPALAVFLVYALALFLALALLYIFGARRWYWHVLSVAAALGIGLTPIPAGWNTPAAELGVGAVFTFLFLWGVLAPLFAQDHRSHHAHARHA